MRGSVVSGSRWGGDIVFFLGRWGREGVTAHGVRIVFRATVVFGYIEGSFLVSRTGDVRERYAPNICLFRSHDLLDWSTLSLSGNKTHTPEQLTGSQG